MARFKIKEINIDEIVFLEKNAHFMEQTDFNQLVENIKKDGELSSVPFAVYLEHGKYKGKYRVISGNHRVKAGIQAGVRKLYVMYVLESETTNDEKLGIQLSHNSINGKDDLGILRELVNEIKSIEYKEYAHIDESMFEELDNYNYDIVQPNNEVINVSFTFFDVNKTSFDTLVEELDTYTPDELENTYLLPKSELIKFNKVVSKVQDKFKIKAYGLSILKMVEIVNTQLNGTDKEK